MSLCSTHDDNIVKETFTVVVVHKYHHSTKLYQRISHVCCSLYCYECAAYVTVSTTINEGYFGGI